MAPALSATRLDPTDPELGLAGERIAARRLARLGLRVRARRWKTPEAEVDLVLTDGPELVVCEVKTGRRAGRWRPGDRLGPRTLERLGRAARGLSRALGAPSWRVDLVEVLVAPTRGFHLGRPEIRWVRGLAGGSARRGSRRDRDPGHSFGTSDRR